MDKPAAQRNQFANREFNGLFAQILLRYLETSAPEGSVERVLQLAGETRSVTELVDASKWSTYTQFRRLLEGAGEVLGGPDGLFQVGKHIYDSIHSPELSESLSVFPTPADVYAALPAIMESTAPVFELRTESTGPNECRMSIRFKGGYEPFPENCAFVAGVLAAMPRLSGYEDAEVVNETCQCNGAPYCQSLVRWEAIDSDAVRATRAEMTARLSQARLEELHHTVAQLVSGDSLETVLTQVMGAAGRAVPALSYILAVTPSARADRWLCSEGIDDPECAAILELLESNPETVSHKVCTRGRLRPQPLRPPRGRPLGGLHLRASRAFDPRVLRPLGGQRPRFGGLHLRGPPTGDHRPGVAQLVERTGRPGLDRRDDPAAGTRRALGGRL